MWYVAAFESGSGGRGCAREKERGYPIPFSLIIAPATQAIGTVEWGEAADL